MNKYQVEGVVGEGAYGVVLKCLQKVTNETVAVKKFKESEEDDVVRKTTLREVKILRMLKHRCIVALREAFRRKGKLYLVFEYLERNLLEVLEDHPNGLDAELVRLYIFQLVLAIEFCHRNNIIHRDIKPENLLVNPDNTLKLCDFGFARTVSSDDMGQLTDYVATRWYRAPELLLGSTTYNFQVDVWAIGCIMGELIDGQPLFPGDTELDQLFVIQRMLGSLTPAQMEAFNNNKRFAGVLFPEMRRTDSLTRRFSRKAPKKALNFLKAIMHMDPAKRLSSRECVTHPYFDGLLDEFGLREEFEPRRATPPRAVATVPPESAVALSAPRATEGSRSTQRRGSRQRVGLLEPSRKRDDRGDTRRGRAAGKAAGTSTVGRRRDREDREGKEKERDRSMDRRARIRKRTGVAAAADKDRDRSRSRDARGGGGGRALRKAVEEEPRGRHDRRGSGTRPPVDHGEEDRERVSKLRDAYWPSDEADMPIPASASTHIHAAARAVRKGGEATAADFDAVSYYASRRPTSGIRPRSGVRGNRPPVAPPPGGGMLPRHATGLQVNTGGVAGMDVLAPSPLAGHLGGVDLSPPRGLPPSGDHSSSKLAEDESPPVKPHSTRHALRHRDAAGAGGPKRGGSKRSDLPTMGAPPPRRRDVDYVPPVVAGFAGLDAMFGRAAGDGDVFDYDLGEEPEPEPEPEKLEAAFKQSSFYVSPIPDRFK